MANFLQDNEGNNSSMRLGYFIWVIGVFFAWGFVVITTKTIPEIPSSIVGILGIVLSGKVIQKHVEVNAPKDQNAATQS